MSEGDPGGDRDRLIPWSRVRDLTGLSRTTVWRLQRTGAFPSPLALSPGRVGWLDSEVAAWTQARREREPLDGDRFERRPGGRPPARVAGPRPSRVRASEEKTIRELKDDAPQDVPPESVATEVVTAGVPRASPRRAPRVAPGQLAFDF
ncbi:MAG: AlpA family phage regulatory protein [Brevundimonas sp.]|nr:MAG: AlpA family phage regulatory protein [Brevundimonas sp.]